MQKNTIFYLEPLKPKKQKKILTKLLFLNSISSTHEQREISNIPSNHTWLDKVRMIDCLNDLHLNELQCVFSSFSFTQNVLQHYLVAIYRNLPTGQFAPHWKHVPPICISYIYKVAYLGCDSLSWSQFLCLLKLFPYGNVGPTWLIKSLTESVLIFLPALWHMHICIVHAPITISRIRKPSRFGF